MKKLSLRQKRIEYIRKNNVSLINEFDYLINILIKMETSLNFTNNGFKKSYAYFNIHGIIEYLSNKTLFIDMNKNNFKMLNNLILETKKTILFYSNFLDKRTSFNKDLIEQINNIV